MYALMFFCVLRKNDLKGLRKNGVKIKNLLKHV